MVLQHLCIYGRVGLLCNQTKDSLNFRGVTILFLSWKKERGCRNGLDSASMFFQNPKKETAPGCWIMHTFFQNLRKRLVLGAGSHDRRQPTPSKWSTKARQMQFTCIGWSRLALMCAVIWIHVSFTFFKSIPRLLLEKPPKNWNVGTAQFLHWEGCWFGCIEQWAT
jgi:hypothetical protein